MWGKLAVLQAVALSVTACGVSGVEGDPWNDPLAGEWVGCLNEGAGDYGRRMYFYADSFSSTTSTYSTNDRTCGGTETSVATEIWRFALGEQVTAQVGSAGTAVTARQINLQNSFETLFTIVYVDEQSTPRLLYFGELALDPLQDGSAPEKRPEVLSVATTLAGQ
jgi:hypothetical protein